jgi:shikimate dehydrogenase
MKPSTSVSYAFGVIGYPLGHSLSPRLHAAALRSCGLQGEYRLYPVPPLPAGKKDLEGLITAIRQGRLDGLNVTIPHKQDVIPYLDSLTPLAKHIGAVNTIFRQGSRLVGDNTDAPGFMADLLEQCPQASAPQSALVLGAGGSARAVVYALSTAGWQVALVARRPEQADELIGSLSIQDGSCIVADLQYLPEAVRTLVGHSSSSGTIKAVLRLIVNTTPLGMHPDIHHSPWPTGLPFPAGTFVYDLVYNPVETLLVRAARSAGLEAASGLGMLIEQAALSFERWTGVHPSVQAMRQEVGQLF